METTKVSYDKAVASKILSSSLPVKTLTFFPVHNEKLVSVASSQTKIVINSHFISCCAFHCGLLWFCWSYTRVKQKQNK